MGLPIKDSWRRGYIRSRAWVWGQDSQRHEDLIFVLLCRTAKASPWEVKRKRIGNIWKILDTASKFPVLYLTLALASALLSKGSNQAQTTSSKSGADGDKDTKLDPMSNFRECNMGQCAGERVQCPPHVSCAKWGCCHGRFLTRVS